MKKTTAYARKRGLSTVPKSDRWAFIEARKSNGISINNERNTLLTPAEVQYLLADPTAGLAGLRSGRGSYDNILSMNAVLKKGQAIEDARVIVRGFAGIYAAADGRLEYHRPTIQSGRLAIERLLPMCSDMDLCRAAVDLDQLLATTAGMGTSDLRALLTPSHRPGHALGTPN